MGFAGVIIMAAVTFGVCFALDKLYTRTFRNKEQHATGLSVRANKRYGVVGVLMVVLGIAAVIFGIPEDTVLWVCGLLIIAVGIGLIVYYLSFGVYYDADSFIVSSFGKKSRTYRFGDIKAQQLYVASGTVVIELHMKDNQTVSLQAGMEGVYAFMDIAFDGWCRQTGVERENCDFYDPAQSCWFPAWEAE